MEKRVVFLMTWDLAQHCIWSTAWLDDITMLAPGLQQLSWEVESYISTLLCFVIGGCVAMNFMKSFWYEINRQLYPNWWSMLSCWKCHCVPASMLHIFFNPIVSELCRNIGHLILQYPLWLATASDHETWLEIAIMFIILVQSTVHETQFRFA